MRLHRHVGKIILFLICLVGAIPVMFPMMVTAASNNSTNVVQEENVLSSLQSTDFFIVNNLAYIDQGRYWNIVDVTDPLTPVLLGHTTHIPDDISDVKVVDNIAYIAGGFDGFVIVDLNPDDPTNPTVLSTLGEDVSVVDQLGFTLYALRVDVANDVAYVSGSGNIYTIDVSVPTQPALIDPGSLVGSLSVINSVDASLNSIRTYDIKVVDDIAYVVTFSNEPNENTGLVTLDVSDPENTLLLQFLHLDNGVQLEVRNNIAYVFDDNHIHVVDVSNPEEMSLLTTYGDGTAPIAKIEMEPQNDVMSVMLDVDDGEVYLLKLDISDPSELIELDRTLTTLWGGGEIYDIWIVGDYFFSHRYGPLYISSLNDDPMNETAHRYVGPTSSAQPSSWELFPNGGSRFFLADELAYVDRGSYWEVVDITDPDNLTLLGRTTDIPNGMASAKVVGNIAYITHWSDGLTVVDINPAYPTQPIVLSDFQMEGVSTESGLISVSPGGIDIVGDVAYLGTDGITIVDISDPTQPTLIGVLDVTGRNTYAGTSEVQIVDGIAYIVNANGFYMIDVSDPANPILLGHGTLEYGTLGVGWVNKNIDELVIRGDIVYAIVSGDHMSIFDVSEPADIKLVARYANDDDESTWQGIVKVEEDAPIDGMMYVVTMGNEGNHLVKLDVSNPFAPIELETIPVDNFLSPDDTAIVGNYLYYRGEYTSLLALCLDGDVADCPSSTPTSTPPTATPTVVSTVEPDVTPEPDVTFVPPPIPTIIPTPVITEPIELDVRSGLEDVLLRWQVVEPLEEILDHYNVYRYQLGTVIVPVLVSSQLGSHYVDVDDFAAGQSYCYYVEAIDENDAVITSSNINCTTFGELQLVVPHVVLPPGGTEIAVPVTVLNGNGLCPVSLDITFGYDASLVTAVNVEQTAYTADYRFEASIDQPGRVSIASITGNCDPLVGSGALFNVLFDVGEDVGAVSSLSFVEGITATAIYNNNDNEPTALRMVNGSLTVGTEATRGDINEDEVINAFDAFLALEIVVGSIEPMLQQNISCDVNGDGSCNTADSSLILCYAAYETWDSCDLTATRRSRSARQQATTTLSKGELSGGKLPILIHGGAAVSGGTVTFTYDPTLIQLNGIETVNSVIDSWSLTTEEETGLLRVAFADDEPMRVPGTLFTINATPLVDGATVQWAGAQFNDGLGLDWESNLGYTIVYEDSAGAVPLAVSVSQQTAWSSASLVGLFMLLLGGLTLNMWRVSRAD